MLEYPEVVTVSKQLSELTQKKVVSKVFPPVKPHKFCWFNGDPSLYDGLLSGSSVKNVSGFGIFVEMDFSNGRHLCFNDGVHPCFFSDFSSPKLPKNYQMLILFSDNSCVVFTVAMYGGLYLHAGSYDNEYYLKSKKSFLIGSKEFHDSFYEQLDSCKPSMSAKAFLATDQHFPGIGNGVIQDILFNAKINPRRQIASLDSKEKDVLFNSTVSVLSKMAEQGGRDTELDAIGINGGYKTLMSKKTASSPCPVCGTSIVKETYLGGSVYYCPKCQSL